MDIWPPVFAEGKDVTCLLTSYIIIQDISRLSRENAPLFPKSSLGVPKNTLQGNFLCYNIDLQAARAAGIVIFGPVAQLGERSVRIHMNAHPSASIGPQFWRKNPPQIVKTKNFKTPPFVTKNRQKAAKWAHSSAGRAPGSQSGSRGFEPLWVHHFKKNHRQFGGDFSFDHNNTTDGNIF